MNNMLKKLIRILPIIVVIALSSGCGLFVSSAGLDQQGNQANSALAATVISSEKDVEAQKLINEYFNLLFSLPTVDEYTENSVKGVIPDNIREHIASKTISEGDGNPEIGIHLPRFVSLNGETIISYEIPKITDNTGEDSAYISSSFISRNEETMTFFCKIKAKATVVPDNVFLESYTQEDDNSFKKNKNIDPELADTICVELKYDVELVEEDGKLKILRAIESNIKPGLKNRLFLMNNENTTRLPYLDISKKADGSGYNNPADGEVYEAEKSVISSLFKNFVALDRERMNLLSYKWDQGFDEVKEYFDNLGITKDQERNIEVIILTKEYAQEMPFESLPLRYNMEKIKSIDNITVSLHPAYSEKRKLYFVNFDATVQRINGITDEDFRYRYDYLVIMATNDDGQAIIDNIKLNEYYVLQ